MLPRSDELWCGLRPRDAIEQSVSQELYAFCNGASNMFGGVNGRYIHEDFGDSFSSQSHIYDEPVLLQDCMWPGTTTGNGTKSKLPPDPPLEIESQTLLPSKDLLDMNCVPESANDNASASRPVSTVSYTPDSDHCYFQPKSVPKLKLSHSRICEDDDDDSDSDSSGNSGDEIDIETVTDDGPSLCAIKLQRTMKKGYFQRENLPPSSYRSYSGHWRVSGNVQRTKHLNQKRKPRTKKGRRPANSLPSSPKGSSRSNSDSEEPVQRRSIHNNMERRRREEQRSALQHLRVQIPELKCEPKAPKVTILKKAKAYIMHMEARNYEYQQTKDTLHQKQLMLLKKLKTLDRNGLLIKEFEDCYR